MTTEVQNILPIPSYVAVGSGGYTVPANKYGYAQYAASSCTYKAGDNTGIGNGGSGQPSARGSVSATANNGQQWLSAGSTIAIVHSHPAKANPYDGNTGSAFGLAGYSAVLVNGVHVCMAYAGAFGSFIGTSTFTFFQMTGNAGWSVSVFDIPKNNLPPELVV